MPEAGRGEGQPLTLTLSLKGEGKITVINPKYREFWYCHKGNNRPALSDWP
jgi:hypothetical protein